MRVRLILENGGHAMTKLVDVAGLPVVGSVFAEDRPRYVSHLSFNVERGVTDVYLQEDEHDLATQAMPDRHLARLEFMRAARWEVEDETDLRAQLQAMMHQQDGAESSTIDLAASVRAMLDEFPADVVLRAVADRLESHARWAGSQQNDTEKAKALEKDAESIRTTGARLSPFGRARVLTREPVNKRRSS